MCAIVKPAQVEIVFTVYQTVLLYKYTYLKIKFLNIFNIFKILKKNYFYRNSTRPATLLTYCLIKQFLLCTFQRLNVDCNKRECKKKYR